MASLWTEYDSDFETFYGNDMEGQKQYAGNHGIVAKTGLPDNNYMVGMLPRAQFTSYTPVPYGSGSNYFPVLQAGRFFDKGDRKTDFPNKDGIFTMPMMGGQCQMKNPSTYQNFILEKFFILTNIKMYSKLPIQSQILY